MLYGHNFYVPAGRAVTTVHHGSAAALPLAYRAAFAAVDELAATVDGPVIEEYVAVDGPGASSGSVRVLVPLSG